MTNNELHRRTERAIACVDGHREWPDSMDRSLSTEIDYLWNVAADDGVYGLVQRLKAAYSRLTE